MIKALTSTVKSIVLLPLYLVKAHLIVPIGKWALKNKLNQNNEKLQGTYSENRDLHEKYKVLKLEHDEFVKKIERIRSFAKRNKGNDIEISLTANDEIVVLAIDEREIISSIELCGENVYYKNYDAEINFIFYENKVKIVDFRSFTRGRGYGRVLMHSAIQYFRRSECTEIFGDLSKEDEANFNWLIPFYQSFGFSCEFFEKEDSMILGRISMTL